MQMTFEGCVSEVYTILQSSAEATIAGPGVSSARTVC